MSDIQSNEPSSKEPSAPVASVEEGKPIESGAPVESTQSADTSIPSGSETSSAGEYVSPTVSEIVEAVKADTRDMAANSGGNVAAAVEGGAPVTGDALADGGDFPRSGNQLVNSGVTLDAPAAGGDVLDGTDADGKPVRFSIEGVFLPRESHLMLLEHKLAAMHAKFKTGERIVIDEFEQILAHIKAVLK